MLAFARPLKVHTPNGTVYAQYAMVPTRKGEPWWVLYHSDNGHWFAAMADRGMPVPSQPEARPGVRRGGPPGRH